MEKPKKGVCVWARGDRIKKNTKNYFGIQFSQHTQVKFYQSFKNLFTFIQF